MDPATKQCPFCAETIRAVAIMCRSCGRDLRGPRRLVTPSGSQCSVCQASLAPGASSCPQCKTGFMNAPAVPIPVAAPPPTLVRTGGRYDSLFLVLFMVVALIFGSIYYILESGASSTTASQPDSVSAFVMCEQFVTAQLKAPATAAFPTYGTDGTETEQLGAVQFRERAYVDLPTSPGAHARTQYTCTVSSIGNNWHLDALTIDH